MPRIAQPKLLSIYRTGEAEVAEGADPSLLSADSFGGGEAGYLDLPILGRLKLDDTVYLMREGPRTFGMVFARDSAARPCTLTLRLRQTDGAWRATVERVTREGAHSRDGVGASFLFGSRQWRENEFEDELSASGAT